MSEPITDHTGGTDTTGSPSADAPRRRLRSAAALAAVVLLGAAVPVAFNAADAAPDFDCSGQYQIEHTMANGAKWQMCWERKNREGILLHEVTYTPVGGQPVQILGQAGLAQIHVPYDDNGARFHDLSDYGLGTVTGPFPHLADLQPPDCPNGQRLQHQDMRHDLCLTEAPTGYAYKDYAEVAQATSLNLFSVSHIGAYNYVVAWNFDDDGTIRPEVGATGSLQRYNNGPPGTDGWDVGQGRSAIAHMHNYYWRLDFDVDGTRLDDRVQELEARPAAGRTQLRNTRRGFTREVARRVGPTVFRTWRVRDTVVRNADGHPISFEILPNTDHIFRGPTYERFTQNELYVTRYRPCERFASRNVPTGNCQGAPNDHVAAFANGESLTNRDLVVWYGSSFHHLPRDEDEEHMHPHWTGFSIIPRDLTATNPAVTGP